MDPQWRNVDPQESLKNKDQSYSRDKPLKMFFFLLSRPVIHLFGPNVSQLNYYVN